MWGRVLTWSKHRPGKWEGKESLPRLPRFFFSSCVKNGIYSIPHRKKNVQLKSEYELQVITFHNINQENKEGKETVQMLKWTILMH